MRDLNQITVIGMGLLGGSLALAANNSLPGVKVAGYSHRPSTRRKARGLSDDIEIFNDIGESVREADLVILATPIFTFEDIFCQISGDLPDGCIVTDVGSTKVVPHRWAAKKLGSNVSYVGSHPIAGSEQRGVKFARDDLFHQSMCIVTKTKKSDVQSVKQVKKFWSDIGCAVVLMGPAEHDRIFARVSHVPHAVAASLVNASSDAILKFAGKGFIDTSRIASGPSNIWSDILLANGVNTASGIDKVISELEKLKKAIKDKDRKRIETILEKACGRRGAMIAYKMKKKELLQ